MWAVVRALVCGVLLTLAAANVDNVRIACGWRLDLTDSCAVDQNRMMLRQRGWTSNGVLISSPEPQALPSVKELLQLNSTVAWSAKMPHYDTSTSTRLGVDMLVVHVQGWPLRAFLCTQDTSSKFGSALVWEFRGHGMFLGLRPLWSGLIFDVLFFACLTSLLWDGPCAVKRWKRRRAGNCVSCGYSRAGLPADQVCPECGGKA